MLKRSGLIMALIVGMVAVVLWPLPTAAQTQQGCTEFRAIGQATLPSPYNLLASGPNVWGGDVYGSLGGEYLSGNFSGNDGETTNDGVTGMGTNGTYTYVFGTLGSFTVNVTHGTWQFAPGKVGVGNYSGAAKIVEGDGTGIFRFASGELQMSGPFIVWPDGSSPIGVQGRFNADLSGSICGVQSAP